MKGSGFSVVERNIHVGTSGLMSKAVIQMLFLVKFECKCDNTICFAEACKFSVEFLFLIRVHSWTETASC